MSFFLDGNKRTIIVVVLYTFWYAALLKKDIFNYTYVVKTYDRYHKMECSFKTIRFISLQKLTFQAGNFSVPYT